MIDQITTYANMIETVSSKRGYPPVTNAIKAALLWFLLAFSNANLNLEDILILFQIGEMWREFNGSKREARLYIWYAEYIYKYMDLGMQDRVLQWNKTRIIKAPFFSRFWGSVVYNVYILVPNVSWRIHEKDKDKSYKGPNRLACSCYHCTHSLPRYPSKV